MEDTVYVSKKLVSDESVGEIDFDLYEEFGFSYDTHSEFVELAQGQGRVDGYPIRIDRMIEILNRMKEKGATHVELDYHCDHIGYDISGYLIEPASQEQIDVHNEKLNKRNAKSQKIAELQAQIKEIQSAD